MQRERVVESERGKEWLRGSRKQGLPNLIKFCEGGRRIKCFLCWRGLYSLGVLVSRGG